MKSKFITITILLASMTNSLFAASQSRDTCLSLELTIHNKSNQIYYLSFPADESKNVQLSNVVKPNKTTILRTTVTTVQVTGYLSFSIDIGRGKRFHVIDPFNTYQGIFSVMPETGSDDLQITINSKKTTDPGQGTCLFVNEATLSISERNSLS
jgi:hypothetical protein